MINHQDDYLIVYSNNSDVFRGKESRSEYIWPNCNSQIILIHLVELLVLDHLLEEFDVELESFEVNWRQIIYQYFEF